MAVAYVVAHEEGHNIQNELGLDEGRVSTQGLELDADCLAGAWAADAASRGVVNKQDVEEAQVTAWLVGDYAFDDPGHHGTPSERQAAFTNGYDDLSSCQSVPVELLNLRRHPPLRFDWLLVARSSGSTNRRTRRVRARRMLRRLQSLRSAIGADRTAAQRAFATARSGQSLRGASLPRGVSLGLSDEGGRHA